MGKYNGSPYLEEMKDEIEISYPQDVLTIISERKKATAAGSCSSGAQNDATPDPALPSAQNFISTLEPILNFAPSSSNQPENNSAIGK